MDNTYADLSAPLREVLHGSARLHVALGRMDGAGVTTRGWSFNDLVDAVIALSEPTDAAMHQARCIAVLWDTLDGVCDIGAAAVLYLADLQRMGERA